MGIANEKKKYIGETAKTVFIEKGFQSVTMSDIVKACGISRGNLYMYFSSPFEIFLEVLDEERLLGKLDFEKHWNLDMDSVALFELYLEGQKQYIMSADEGLLTAVYEFFLLHHQNLDKNYVEEDFRQARVVLGEILSYGQNKDEFEDFDVLMMSETILYILEGLKVSATISDMKEELVERQWDHLRMMIYKK